MNGYSNTSTIIEDYVRPNHPEILVEGAAFTNVEANYPAFVACYRY